MEKQTSGTHLTFFRKTEERNAEWETALNYRWQWNRGQPWNDDSTLALYGLQQPESIKVHMWTIDTEKSVIMWYSSCKLFQSCLYLTESSLSNMANKSSSCIIHFNSFDETTKLPLLYNSGIKQAHTALAGEEIAPKMFFGAITPLQSCRLFFCEKI